MNKPPLCQKIFVCFSSSLWHKFKARCTAVSRMVVKNNQLIPGQASTAKGTLPAQWEVLVHQLPVGKERSQECALVKVDKINLSCSNVAILY